MNGKHVVKAKRTIKGADVASITARLTRTARRTLARAGRIKVRLVTAFKPKAGGKAVRIRRTLDIRRAGR